MLTSETKGIIYRLINSMCFALMSVIMMRCVNEVSISQVIFLRVLCGSVICFSWLCITKQKLPRVSTGNLTLYFLRALANYLAFYVWIDALIHIGINEATAIGYLSPLWTFLMAQIVCGEKLDKLTILIVILNFIGVVVVLEPKVNSVNIYGIVTVLLSTLLWSVYDIICKKQTTTEHYIVQTFYTFVITSLIALPSALYTWKPLSFTVLSESFLIGLLGFINVTVLFLAYTHARIIRLIPFSYTRLVFTMLFSFISTTTLPTLGCIFGSLIILISNMVYFIKSDKRVEVSA